MAVAADVTDRGAMVAAVAQVAAQLGEPDVVIANAGIAVPLQTLLAGDPDVFERVVDVNLLGVHRTVHAALPHIVRRGGHVVVVASVYAFLNGALAASYAVAKAGVEQYGRALRVELAGHGATAGVAYFGIVDTALVHDTLGAPAGRRLTDLLPGALTKPLAPDAAATALADGIQARRARIVAPSRWSAFLALRGIANPPLDRWLERHPTIHEVAAEVDAAPPPIPEGVAGSCP